MSADEDYVLYSRTPQECDYRLPVGDEDYKEVIITKIVANQWMSHFPGNRSRGMQFPITGIVHQQRRTTSRLKDIEENFAKRGIHFLEGHAVRESDVMSVGDVEAIHRFDRVPVAWQLRQGFWRRIIDSWMPPRPLPNPCSEREPTPCPSRRPSHSSSSNNNHQATIIPTTSYRQSAT